VSDLSSKEAKRRNAVARYLRRGLAMAHLLAVLLPGMMWGQSSSEGEVLSATEGSVRANERGPGEKRKSGQQGEDAQEDGKASSGFAGREGDAESSGRSALASQRFRSGAPTPVREQRSIGAPDEIGGTEPTQHGISEEEYSIGIGDVIQVSVWREPDVSVESAVVRSDGRISLPLIKEIMALGLTPKELESVLARAFSRFIKEPNVTVIVREMNSRQVHLVGGVVSPGSIQLKGGPITVLQALAEAGGLTEFANKKDIYVLRREDGEDLRLPFNYKDVVKGKNPEQNIFVAPGDTIVVPE